MNVSNKITGIIPTFNEEEHIIAAIDSLNFADEIIVLDSFSTDTTLERAKSKGVKILQRKFDNFSSQKNFAIENAAHSWIFLLDADERISIELKKEILEVVSKSSKYTAYWIFRSNYFMKRKIKYSGWQNDKVIRLFIKEKSLYDGKLVHEEIQTEGEIGYLKNKLEHYTYKGFISYIQKKNHYAQLQAKELAKKGLNPGVFHFLLKPLYRFINHYFLRCGFLDGIEGLFIAIFSAYSIFARYVNLWLLNRGLK